MTHRIGLFFVVFLLVASAALAQTPTFKPVTTVPTTSTKGLVAYAIEEGDSLWRLKQAQWEILLKYNPQLRSRVRRVSADEVYVHLNIGEPILVPTALTDALGVTPKPTPAPVVGDQLKQLKESFAKSAFDVKKAEERDLAPLYFLLGLVALAAIALAIVYIWTQYQRHKREDERAAEGRRADERRRQTELEARIAEATAQREREAQATRDREAAAAAERLAAEARQAATEARERELQQNPVTSGPAVVAGGILPTETQRLADHFSQQAIERFIARHPGTDRATVRPTRIGPVEEGMISGEGMVGYLDQARPRRIDPAQAGFRARFRFPDGTEELLMSLQGCMNPCYYGEGMTGFTFVAGRAVVPPPAEPSTALVPATHPTIMARMLRETAGAEGITTLETGEQIIALPAGCNITTNRDTATVTLPTGDVISIRTRRRLAKAAKPKASTGEAS